MLAALFMWLLALGTVYGGSLYAQALEKETGGFAQFVDLDVYAVALFPVTASAMLLLLFSHFGLMQYILLGAVFGLAFLAVMDVSRWILVHRMGVSPSSRLVTPVSLATTLLIMWEWTCRGNFLAIDAIGISLCFTLIATLRFPSLKLGGLCLGLLFLYDIFWVFLSPYFFGHNVMVVVAEKQAASPIQQAGEHFNIPFLKQFVPRLELPLKLILPSDSTPGRYVMLGLGDMALPGVLLNYAFRFVSAPLEIIKVADIEQQPALEPQHEPLAQEQTSKLFAYAFGGYAFGLATAFFVSMSTGHAQPALIYIVPGILVPLCCRAAAEGKLVELWQGAKLERIE